MQRLWRLKLVYPGGRFFRGELTNIKQKSVRAISSSKELSGLLVARSKEVAGYYFCKWSWLSLAPKVEPSQL